MRWVPKERYKGAMRADWWTWRGITTVSWNSLSHLDHSGLEGRPPAKNCLFWGHLMLMLCPHPLTLTTSVHAHWPQQPASMALCLRVLPATRPDLPMWACLGVGASTSFLQEQRSSITEGGPHTPAPWPQGDIALCRAWAHSGDWLIICFYWLPSLSRLTSPLPYQYFLGSPLR